MKNLMKHTQDICSPAKVGLVVTELLITSPVVSWRWWETPSPPFRSTWSSGRGGGVSGRAFSARELASVSSVHSWTGDTGVALVR